MAESLENVISLNNNNSVGGGGGGSTGPNNCPNGNLNGNQNTNGTINSSTSGSSLNSNSQTAQRYRIDALATSTSSLIASTSISQTMDGIVDTKLRQGKIII